MVRERSANNLEECKQICEMTVTCVAIEWSRDFLAHTCSALHDARDLDKRLKDTQYDYFEVDVRCPFPSEKHYYTCNNVTQIQPGVCTYDNNSSQHNSPFFITFLDHLVVQRRPSSSMFGIMAFLRSVGIYSCLPHHLFGRPLFRLIESSDFA